MPTYRKSIQSRSTSAAASKKMMCSNAVRADVVDIIAKMTGANVHETIVSRSFRSTGIGSVRTAQHGRSTLLRLQQESR